MFILLLNLFGIYVYVYSCLYNNNNIVSVKNVCIVSVKKVCIDSKKRTSEIKQVINHS